MIVVRSRDLTATTNRLVHGAFIQFRVEIDGERHDAVWGENQYAVKPGRHQITLGCNHIMYGKQASREASVDLGPGETCDMQYTVQNMSHLEAILEIDGRPDTSGGVVQGRWKQRRKMVMYFLLVFMGLAIAFNPTFLVPPGISWWPLALCIVAGLYLVIHVSRNLRNK